MSEGAPTPPPQPGWYPDPADPTKMRWWDGRTWADQQVVPLAKSRNFVEQWKSWPKLGRIGSVVGAVLVVIVLVMAAVTYQAPKTEPASAKSPVLAKPKPSESAKATPTLSPTAAPSAPPPAPAPVLMIDRVRKAVGSSSLKVKQVNNVGHAAAWTVEFNVQDNFTSGMIKSGIAIDTYDALKHIHTAGLDVGTIEFVGYFPLQDQYGNSSNSAVVDMVFSQDTIDRINYANIDNTDLTHLMSLADAATLDPAMN